MASVLHNGHLDAFFNHLLRHFLWNYVCGQSNRPWAPPLYLSLGISSEQITHSSSLSWGSSTLLPKMFARFYNLKFCVFNVEISSFCSLSVIFKLSITFYNGSIYFLINSAFFLRAFFWTSAFCINDVISAF